MKALITTLALIAGNFIYQASTTKDWLKAFERSWFQAVAVGTVFLMSPRIKQP